MSDEMKTAVEQMQRDRRFRALVDSTVAAVVADFGEIDPENAQRDAYEMAIRAATLLLKRIYEQDVELMALRVERDAYRDVAFKQANMMPIQAIIVESPHA